MLVSGRVAGSHLVLGEKGICRHRTKACPSWRFWKAFRPCVETIEGWGPGWSAHWSSYQELIHGNYICIYLLWGTGFNQVQICPLCLVSNTLCLKHDSWHHCGLVDQRSMRALSKVEPFTDRNLLGASLGNDLYGKWTLWNILHGVLL